MNAHDTPSGPASPATVPPRRRGRHGRRKSWIAFLSTLMILVIVGLAVVAGMRSLEHHALRIKQSHELIIQTERTVLELRSAEAKQRLYLLTASAEAAARFQTSTAATHVHLEGLRALAGTRSEQGPRVGKFGEAVEARLAHLDGVVETFHQHDLDAAREMIRVGTGLLHSSDVTRLANEIVAVEDTRLLRSDADRARTERRIRLLALGGISLSLVIIGMTVARLLQENRRRLDAELQIRGQVDLANAARQDMVALSQYGGLLQSCRSVEEALQVSQQALTRLLPELGGALYLIRASRDYAELSFHWGELPAGIRESVALDDCWALRRGQPYPVHDLQLDVKCAHIEFPPPGIPAHSVCTPMTVQGQALGFLMIAAEGHGPIAHQPLAAAAAEQLALALFNLRLQEQLQMQSIRDSLTGLFNRRYLEESLVRELARAQRRNAHASVLMIDVDHFKRFNDDHGHDAGDSVLRDVGEMLRAQCRGEDVACRYGGEEFTLILPDVDTDTAVQRAEQIRDAAERLALGHLGRPLPPITLSIGVATYPQHAVRPDGMLRSADAALYAAKKAGRNRVQVAVAGS